jgi:hypothetical protein
MRLTFASEVAYGDGKFSIEKVAPLAQLRRV